MDPGRKLVSTARRLRALNVDYKVVRFHMRTLFWSPFLVGALIALVLTLPQSREAYLSLIEGVSSASPLAFIQAALGISLIVLLCFLLRAWQLKLGTAAIDRIYPEHADIRTDFRLCNWRDWLASMSAVLPLIGLLMGLVRTAWEARHASAQFADLKQRLGETQPKIMSAGIGAETLPNLATSGYVAVLLLLGGAALVWSFRRMLSRRLFANRMSRVYGAVIWGSVAVTAVAALAPLIPGTEPYVVGLARLSGPLASAAVVLIAVTCVIMGISFADNRLRFPVLGTVALLGLVVVGILIYGGLSPPPPKSQANVDPPEKSTAVLTEKFDRWLAARETSGDPGKEYPVFIIAAEGGGIYAADAATSFLSAMQDMCPSFVEHVFAISGVSGGAVGAALFNALIHKRGEEKVGGPERKCNPDVDLFAAGTLSTETRAMVRDDHLSPSLALFVPDIVSKLLPPDASRLNRARALEASFACSFLKPGATGFLCARDPGKGVDMPFAAHWRPDAAAPALVLTSTWVETGYRVAFAPFPLHGASDGTLFSFPMAGASGKDDFKAHGIEIGNEFKTTSLIEAAMVSARFPGIVSAYTVKAILKSDSDQSRLRSWNFVDGGYVDNSGASTALEIYQALSDRPRKRKVGLYLILLTDADYDPSLRNVSDGTSFSDTIAPVSALLSVRNQLAGRAVTRAIDQLAPRSNASDLVGRGTSQSTPTRVMVVDLKQDNFNLPLGWRISNVTDSVIRVMLGEPQFCLPRELKAREGDILTVFRNNSCVKKQLIEILDAGAS